MFYAKEIIHRTTNQADAVNVDIEMAAAFGTKPTKIGRQAKARGSARLPKKVLIVPQPP